jgi:predicted phosphodiesterase
LASAFQNSEAMVFTDKDDNFQFATLPYLQNFNSDTITIFTITNKPSLAWLEVLGTDGNIVDTIYQTEDGMRNANAELFKFIVPHRGKNFNYRIAAKEVTRFDPYKIEYGASIQSPSFQTQLPFVSANDTAHLLILNDIHENFESYQTLYNKSTLPKKDLVICNGDSFHYVSKQEDLAKKLLTPVSNLFASQTPFVMIRGNHETRGSFARDFKKYFDYPEQKFYHTFSLGSTFWIILDGGEDKPDDHDVYAHTVDYDSYRLEQKAWLSKVLQSKERKKAKRTVVVTHIPFFHSDDWHGTLHNRECFHELLQKNKVTAVISGHTHKFGFYPPDKDHNYHVVIGGGPKEGQRTFIEIESSQKQFNLALKKDNGEIIGRI